MVRIPEKIVLIPEIPEQFSIIPEIPEIVFRNSGNRSGIPEKYLKNNSGNSGNSGEWCPMNKTLKIRKMFKSDKFSNLISTGNLSNI